jgi:hypothetical protein
MKAHGVLVGPTQSLVAIARKALADRSRQRHVQYRAHMQKHARGGGVREGMYSRHTCPASGVWLGSGMAWQAPPPGSATLGSERRAPSLGAPRGEGRFACCPSTSGMRIRQGSRPVSENASPCRSASITLDSDPLVPVEVFLPSQLNGKPEGRVDDANRNCAAPATVRRAMPHSCGVGWGEHATGERPPGRSPWCPSARIPANERKRPQPLPSRRRSRGSEPPAVWSGFVMSVSDLLSVSIPSGHAFAEKETNRDRSGPDAERVTALPCCASRHRAVPSMVHCRAAMVTGRASGQGKPLFAECGDALYFTDGPTVANSNGTASENSRFALAGIVPAEARMNSKLTAIGLQSVTLPEGELRGHSYHYSSLESELEPIAVASCPNGGRTSEAVYRAGSTTASYMHFYFASNPEAAARLFRPIGART